MWVRICYDYKGGKNMSKKDCICYVCSKKNTQTRGDWFYKPSIRSGSPPKDLYLCKDCSHTYFASHNGWKNVKATLTQMKKEVKR